jgi:hypothetical protein
MARTLSRGVAAWLSLLVPAVGVRAADPTTAANVPAEITFTAAQAHADPFNGVTLDVAFTGPDAVERLVPAFWAGGKTWKVRYSSGVVGRHAWRSRCNVADAGLDGVTGTLTIEKYAGDNPLYARGPVRVAVDKRHMAYADGTPFFWLGDTWWMGLCKRLAYPADFQKLAADRAQKGFNVVQIVAGLYPDMPPFDPRGDNEAGQPWESGFARVRPAYFDAADERLRHLVDRGITPCIVGAWGYFLPLMGEQKMKQHWRYLIARYGSWPVVFCAAGEANLPYYLAPKFPYDDQETAKNWCDILRYVRATDPFHRPLTIHPTAINAYTARHVARPNGLIDFDLLQTPHAGREIAPVVAKTVRDSLAALPKMPVIDGEAAYERLGDTLPTRASRTMFWVCVANGAAGHTYGANGIWQVNRKGQPFGPSPHHKTGNGYGLIPWDEAMNLPGSTQLGAAKTWLLTMPWDRFEPHPEWAAWVEADAPTLGDWVWLEPGAAKNAPVAARYFLKEFELPADAAVETAPVSVTADDRFTLWVNGTEVASGQSWGEAVTRDVAKQLRPGKNVLAVRAENAPGPKDANPAGLNLALEVALAGGKRVRVATGANWRAAASAPGGWNRPGFDASKWASAAVVAANGTGPWGKVAANGETTPPYAFGLPDGPRLTYCVSSRPVKLVKLAAGKSYRVSLFDPVTGHVTAGGTQTADAGGAVVVSPSFAEDAVVLLEPAAR